MKRGQILPKFRCPICRQFVASAVVDCRPAKGFYWRRRECERCRDQFTTKEIVEALDPPPRNIR